MVGDKKDKVPLALSPEPWQCPPEFIYYSQAQDSDMVQITSGLGKSLLSPSALHSPSTCSFFLSLVTRKCDPTQWGQTHTLYYSLSLSLILLQRPALRHLPPDGRVRGYRVNAYRVDGAVHLDTGGSHKLLPCHSPLLSLLPCRGASVPRQVESLPVHGQNWIETLSTESSIFSLRNTFE